MYLNKAKSETKSIKCGIPQGSVLGPLLFILYVNDLSSASEHLFSILFADDTSVFLEGTSLQELVPLLNIELVKITKWLTANLLTMNVIKSHYMVFHRAKVKNHDDVILSNTNLDRVVYTKFLGVIIDDKLNFVNHIAYIKNKISKGMGIIYKARKFLNKSILVNLYNSFVYPYLV